jgi:hypothetical protein
MTMTGNAMESKAGAGRNREPRPDEPSTQGSSSISPKRSRKVARLWTSNRDTCI